LLAAILHDRIDPRRQNGRHFTSELGCMRNAQKGFRSQPVGDIRPMEASCQLTDAQIFFRPDFITDIASLSSIRVHVRLIENSDKSLRRDRGVLNRGQSPGVEIAQTMRFRFRAIL
jgi:hypothetical protein